MPVQTWFPSPDNAPPLGRNGALGVLCEAALVSNSTAFTIFTLPARARPILWLWTVEDAFNGTTPTMAITVNGGGVTIGTTNMTATGDKFPFLGTTFYPTTDYGYPVAYPVTAQFLGGGSNTTGKGWLKCIYMLS